MLRDSIVKLVSLSKESCHRNSCFSHTLPPPPSPSTLRPLPPSPSSIPTRFPAEGIWCVLCTSVLPQCFPTGGKPLFWSCRGSGMRSAPSKEKTPGQAGPAGGEKAPQVGVHGTYPNNPGPRKAANVIPWAQSLPQCLDEQ